MVDIVIEATNSKTIIYSTILSILGVVY